MDLYKASIYVGPDPDGPVWDPGGPETDERGKVTTLPGHWVPRTIRCAGYVDERGTVQPLPAAQVKVYPEDAAHGAYCVVAVAPDDTITAEDGHRWEKIASWPDEPAEEKALLEGVRKVLDDEARARAIEAVGEVDADRDGLITVAEQAAWYERLYAWVRPEK